MAGSNNLKIKAYGKLNLTLDIAGIRNDGYHLLETVMQSVSVYDLLEFERSSGSGIELICEKEGFPLNEKNLIWKAVDAFFDYCSMKKEDKITVKITKNLPSMAGMAGGSADCAAALAAMNAMYDTKLTHKEICEIGVKLGADVPFCITGGTGLCRGIGEKITKLPSPNCFFVVVQPDLSISTPEAFKKYDKIKEPEHCNTAEFLKNLENGNLSEMCRNMFNVLEYACDSEEIAKVKRQLTESGAITAIMTGSGSAVYGVFPNKPEAEKALEKLGEYRFKDICRPMNIPYEILQT